MVRLLGRKDACDRLDALVEAARRRRSGALVLRGEPGAGKTELLRYAETKAGDQVEVVRLEGIESEMELGFAALHQLLRPSLTRLDVVSRPQADALRSAFGLGDGGRADRFFVGLAALGLLADRATGRPLLLLVDDAHWLDRESGAVLAFVARRLDADAIAMVFATRDLTERDDLLGRLPDLQVEGLAAEESAALLASVAAPRLHPAVRDQILEETGGNPLALIEIGQGLTSAQLAGDLPLPEPLPVGRRLELRYLHEIQLLPDDTQTLLLAAAADPTGAPDLLWQAGKHLGFDAGAAGEAEARGLITIGTVTRFRHPLVRSAVYHGSSLAQRQRVHAALAAATDLDGDPDRKAWHLGEATVGRDETVAVELEHAGDRAACRGGWTAAATFYTRAAALSSDEMARARRLLSGAEASCTAGVPGRAQALLDEAAAHRNDPWHDGLVQRLQGRIYHALRRPAEATAALLAAATCMGPVDIRLARDTLVEAIVEAQVNGSLAPDGITRRDVARSARGLPLPAGMRATPGDLLLDADTALQLEGLAAAGPLLRDAIKAVWEAPEAPERFRWLAAACADATILADDDGLHDLARHMEHSARQQGAVIPLSLALSHAGGAELVAGLLPEAERCFEERAAIEEARGHQISLGSLLVAGWRGEVKQTYALFRKVSSEAAGQGQGYQLVFADYARCVLELGSGHYDKAYASLSAGIDDVCQLKFALADLVEAAHRSGHADVAQRQIDHLSMLATVSPVPRTLGFLARSRALVAGDAPEADPLYQEAIRHHERIRGPAHLARSHLVYGEWLRRARRPKEARHHLRTAHELFVGMGARGFAVRARHELEAAGDTRPLAPAAGTRHELTPQEARVAKLAAQGATNADIAGELYVSANTVDYHLRKVFRKLGVSSRRELGRPDLGLR